MVYNYHNSLKLLILRIVSRPLFIIKVFSRQLQVTVATWVRSGYALMVWRRLCSE